VKGDGILNDRPCPDTLLNKEDKRNELSRPRELRGIFSKRRREREWLEGKGGRLVRRPPWRGNIQHFVGESSGLVYRVSDWLKKMIPKRGRKIVLTGKETPWFIRLKGGGGGIGARGKKQVGAERIKTAALCPSCCEVGGRSRAGSIRKYDLKRGVEEEDGPFPLVGP